MRSRVCVILAFLLFASFFTAAAGAAEPWTEDTPVGEVLYRPSFADVADYEKSGFTTGTATAETAVIAVRDDALNVRCVDGGRAYTLLPQVARGNSYTVEFSFRFTESGRVNGTFAFLLTCRGEEPTNITALVIRGNGTVDDFDEPDEELARAVSGGYWIDVAIPVEDGALHRMTMTVRDTGASYSLERTSILVLTPGTMGFSFRNTCAAISDVWIVNGVDYAEKTGSFTSFVVDRIPLGDPTGGKTAEGQKQKPEQTRKPETKPLPAEEAKKPPAGNPSPPERSPNTRDRTPGMVAALSVTSACALGCGFSVRKRRVGRRA